MPVIGTAGHVDHGKSTLVRALTGRDPDRWQEEKERGLTIDLGFAWTTLPSGREIGFVDVPGHERFIKNMLAGVDAISVALFVVAADEGWMPQSEEHLAILDLLGIERAVVALTRADLVDGDTVEIATLEIDERLAGTGLSGSPIIPVAAPEDRGIDDLIVALDTALAGVEPEDRGRPRMWVDRSFTISGAGTILTGTLVEGSLAVEDRVVVFPEVLEARVRSLQSHERSVERVTPGNRTAINVTGIDRHEVTRGAMLGLGPQWLPTRRFSADLVAVRSLGEPIRERGSFHLHVGSGSWSARVRLLESDGIEERGIVVVETDVAIPLRWGDRFILREVGRQAVVGGGRVLDPGAPRRGGAALQLAQALLGEHTPDGAATALLAGRGAEGPLRLAAASGGGRPGGAIEAGPLLMAEPHAAQLLERAMSEVDEFHAENPLRPGIPKARLAEQLGVGPDELEALLLLSSEIELTGAVVARAGFGVDLDPEQEAAWARASATLDAAGFAPPTKQELGLPVELEHALIRRGDLVAVSDDLLYRTGTTDDIVERTSALPDGFTVADFRDAIGVTRKHAIPLVEWMDRTGVTIRDGDVRKVVRSG